MTKKTTNNDLKRFIFIETAFHVYFQKHIHDRQRQRSILIVPVGEQWELTITLKYKKPMIPYYDQ